MVDVLRPSLPSLVSFVPSFVFVSKKTPPVGSKSSGARMNQPQNFIGSVSEQLPYSSKKSLVGKNVRLLRVGHRAALVCAEPRIRQIVKIVLGVPDVFADDQIAIGRLLHLRRSFRGTRAVRG